MANFITDSEIVLPDPKVDGASDPTGLLTAAEFNATRDELRSYLRGNLSVSKVTANGETNPRLLSEWATHSLAETVGIGGPNILANGLSNSIANDIHTSTITGGGAPGFPQRIGSTPGSNASYATIGGGYDNTNNQIAGTIAGGAHHNLVATGTHGTIGGGSYNTIGATVEYATIAGGTANTLNGTSSRGFIGGGESNAASGPGAVIVAGISQTNAGNLAAIVGGNSNDIDSNGTAGFIGGGTNNAIDGVSATYGVIAGGTANHIDAKTGGAIVGGNTNLVSSTYGFVGTGLNNTAGGTAGAVITGVSNTTSGQYATVINGQQNSASGDYSSVVGLRGSASLSGQHSHANGYFAAVGDAQGFTAILRRSTTNATVTSMALDGVGALATLADSTTWTFSILVTARCQTSGESAGYKFEGVIERGVGAATTALVGSVTKTVLAEDAAAWDVSVTADTTGGDLRIKVTGEAAKTIRWVARLSVVSVSG